ncbi:hypothetical protein [Brevibacterium otitidis]|uniref:Permuted papain-like amidase enzyme, YaeF/YiiX, C92 family n=1 Tax=Brevibacterium otitidis TaxID=53364 RepID=A0ABV5X140_9MICO|nr:hypothetical protein GCM10023233_08670 [Brevibacterium otitidis]
MLRKKHFLAGLLLAGAVALSGGVPATAAESPASAHLSPQSPQALEKLENLNPGTSDQELMNGLSAYAAERGITLEQALQESLRESEESAQAASEGSSGGVSTYATRTLGAAKAKGDIFVSPASTLFIKHGHTGIYYTTGTIVEAPGKKAGGKTLKSRSYAASKLSVGKGAVKQSVGVSTAKRKASANHAYSKLRGKPYNTSFAANKKVNGSTMNCSQLVWAAYKVGGRIDLDSNGGPGVYPYNIKNSKYTKTYKTL